MIQESCRPRVSDRTMVGNSATRLACESQRTEWRRHISNMKPQGGKSIQGPLLRGLAGRSTTGQNDQAAAEQMWRLGLGAGCRKNIPAIPAGRSVFLLDIPFNRTSRPSELTRQKDGLHARSVHTWEKPTSGPCGSQRVTFRFARHTIRIRPRPDCKIVSTNDW
jgi:hypothetical protein